MGQPVATGRPTRSPRRTCIGCRRVARPDELVRLRWTGTDLEVGPGPGRGAWLCRASDDCLQRAVRRGAVERALRASFPTLDLAALRAKLAVASCLGMADAARTSDPPGHADPSGE